MDTSDTSPGSEGSGKAFGDGTVNSSRLFAYDCAEGNLSFSWFAENDYVLYNIFQYFYSLIHGSLTRIQFPKQEQDVSLFLVSFWKVKQTSF